jgi:hypothetical protein
MLDMLPWLGGASTALGALGVVLKRRAEKGALEAECRRLAAALKLEQEKQETAVQSHLMARLTSLEGSRDVQAELIANLTHELALSREKLSATAAELQKVTRMLLAERRSKRELTVRVRGLEAKLKAEQANAAELLRQWEADKLLGRPSHESVAPPGAQRR